MFANLNPIAVAIIAGIVVGAVMALITGPGFK